MDNFLEILEIPEKLSWESDEAYKLRMVCRMLKKAIDSQQEEIDGLKRRLLVEKLNLPSRLI